MWFLLQSKQDIQKFIDKFGQETYERFLKNKQRLSSKGQSADILLYVKNYDVDQLNQLLDDIENKVVKDETGKTKNNVVKVAENEDYIVYDVLDWQTAINLGDGTNWCISGRYETNGEVKPSQAKQFFDKYKSQGVKFYLFCIPKNPRLQKYCIVVYSNDRYECWDSQDKNLRQYIPGQIPSIDYKGFEWQKPVYLDASKLYITSATLLYVDEVEQVPIKLRKYSDFWWLRTPGYSRQYVEVVRCGGTIYSKGDNVANGFNLVRPALKISNVKSSNLEVGDVFWFGGKPFQVISDNLAFCLSDIGQHWFRKDWKAEDANDYETSDVKKYIDEWFKKAKNQVG